MSSSAKIVCLLAENLPVQIEQQRLGGGPQPLIIAHPVARETVFAVSDEAAAAGVQVGMSVYQARQCAPSALVLDPDEMAYHAAHSAIEAALRAFSPLIETVGLGEFMADLRGAGRIHGDDQALAGAICAAARSASGLAVCAGLASGKFTAQQAARAAPPDSACILPPGAEARFLAPLPVDVLPHLPGEMRRRLALLDLHTLGDLTAIRKPAVLRQFGADISGLYELARGDDPRPLNPDAPPLRAIRSLQFNDPVTDRRALLHAAGRLCWRLSQALAGRGYHAEALKLSLVMADGGTAEAGRSLRPPTADEGRLARMAGQLLGRLPSAAPVARLTLSVYPVRSWHLGARQMTLAESANRRPAQTRFEEALALIRRRFGELAIRIAALLGPPLPIPVLVSLNAQGRPARFSLGGDVKVIVGLDEFWREEKRWWDRPLHCDYFRVLLADGSLRNLFQDLTTGEWYLDRAWPIL